MRAHSVYVEERTVYVCSCKAEFESMREAEAHLRSPGAERSKAPKASRPKARAARRPGPTSATVEDVDTPTPGIWTPTDQ